MTPNQNKWLTGCGLMLLFGAASLFILALTGERLLHDAQQSLNVEAAARHYLIGFSYFRRQQLHFIGRRPLPTSGSPQMAIQLVDTAQPYDGYLPVLISPLVYADNRCVVLAHFPMRRIYGKKALTDFKEEFGDLAISLTELIDQTDLSKNLKPAPPLSERAGQEAAGE